MSVSWHYKAMKIPIALLCAILTITTTEKTSFTPQPMKSLALPKRFASV
ncbi:MAG: hypothetical protein WA883_17855 [Phormidesmis sp.]